MTADGDAPTLPAAPPDRDRWAALPDDLFTRIVPHVRRGLSTLEGVHVTPEVRRLQAVPASKLGRGRTRRRLLAVLAEGGPAWVAVRQRILADTDVADGLALALAAADARDATDGAGNGDEDEEVVASGRLAEALAARDDHRAQRDQARAERDDARRRTAGAEGREASLRDEVDALQARVGDLEALVGSLRDDLAAAEGGIDAAVARATRRTASDRAELTADLAAARREVDGLRRARARREALAVPATPSSRRPRARTVSPPTGQALSPDRIVPGRPSRVPPGLRLDTREGAARLVDAVGHLLVDGYNVTRTHRADLDLAGQRDWLVRGLEGLVARRRVDATVVFDAHLDGAGGDRPRARGPVRVMWSHHGVTADDEIVFAVEARDADDPIVVVTDDRGLRARLAPSRVDLVPTASLTWLLG